MNKPKITVITPSFQQADYLEGTILSVLDQGYENLEYIIIDGGSTDGSVDIIKKYEQNLSYWESCSDKGQSHAINKGLQRASGDIITWLNSDDKLRPDVLNRISGLFTEDIGLVYGDTLIVTNDGHTWESKGITEFFIEQMIGGMPFSQPSCFFNGRIVRKYDLSLQEDLHYGMDYYFFLQLFCVSDFRYTPGLISEYLFHPLSKSSAHNSMFANDWSSVYCSFLNHVDSDLSERRRIFSTQELATDLSYPGKPRFTDKQIENSYFYYLLNQMKFRYKDLDLSLTREILNQIKLFYPEEYKTRNLSKIAFRSHFPKKVIKTFRKKHAPN